MDLVDQMEIGNAALQHGPDDVALAAVRVHHNRPAIANQPAARLNGPAIRERSENRVAERVERLQPNA